MTYKGQGQTPLAHKEMMMAKSRVLDTDHEREYWCGRMIKPSPLPYLSTMDQYRHIMSLMGHGAWTLITGAGVKREWAKMYVDKYGRWMHSAGYTEAHNNLGMAWAWWANEYSRFDKLFLSDSPDIYGELEGQRVIGDIGQCTYIAWCDGIMGSFGFHDLWISVLDYDTQVVVEAQANIGMMMSTVISTKLFPTPENIKREKENLISYFDCPLHGSHYDMNAVRTAVMGWTEPTATE